MRNLIKRVLTYSSIAAILLVSPGCSSFRPGFISEDSFKVENKKPEDKLLDGVGPLGGHFDGEGNWIPDNPEIAWTYKIPDIGAGIIFDIKSLDITPSLQIELLEVDTHIPYLRTLKLDFGVGYQRAYLYVGKLWTNIFEITTGGGRNSVDRTGR